MRPPEGAGPARPSPEAAARAGAPGLARAPPRCAPGHRGPGSRWASTWGRPGGSGSPRRRGRAWGSPRPSRSKPETKDWEREVARKPVLYCGASGGAQRGPAARGQCARADGGLRPAAPPGASSCRSRRAASVQLDGAAVVLTVLALLLRGAHEAAQKVPWKQMGVRGRPETPPSAVPGTAHSHAGDPGAARPDRTGAAQPPGSKQSAELSRGTGVGQREALKHTRVDATLHSAQTHQFQGSPLGAVTRALFLSTYLIFSQKAPTTLTQKFKSPRGPRTPAGGAGPALTERQGGLCDGEEGPRCTGDSADS